MVFVETKIKKIPRREIDALEDLLDKLLKKTGRSECFGRENTNEERDKPFANIKLLYEQGTVKEAFRLEADGITKDSNFNVQLKLNLSDQTYSLLMQNLEKQAPILARGISKNPSYNTT